jgi:hypothetical protein
MFKDDARHEVYTRLREQDLRVFAGLLTFEVFVEAAHRAAVRIWTCPLNCVTLVWLGIAAAWRQSESFVTILTATLKLLQDQEHFDQTGFGQALQRQQRRQRRLQRTAQPTSKHNPHGSDPIQVSEEAFAKARQRLPQTFWLELILLLVERFEAEHGDCLRFRHFRLLAMDGTRLALPDEQALRAYYGTARNGHGRHTAQAQMVLLQSPLTRLPLAYDLQPLQRGEVTLARQLTRHLRVDDLVLLDAGYCSYGLMWDIQRRHAFFCIRVRRGLNLHTLRRLQGTHDRLVRWTPKDSRGQWRREGLPRALDLRLIQYRVPGYRTIQLLTNVLAPAALSYTDLSRLTGHADVAQKLLPGVYHLRWQIETSYAELKVVNQMEAGLRSKTPAGVAYEVAGHVVLYLLIRWLIVAAALAHGLDPLQISFRNAVRELSLLWPTMAVSSPEWVEKVLWPRLLERIAAVTVPSRPGRSYPRKKKTKAKTTKATKKAKRRTATSKQNKS